MKTDKFEKTIRQKLESISPDFQESDWAKMQSYMHVHTPPSLWQQYGSWLGYAAAASVTSVMAFMYVNQLSQNNKLSSDVKILQKQIAVIKENPAQSPKVDTVYILREGGVSRSGELSLRSKTVESDEPKAELTAETFEENSTENIVDSQGNEPKNNVISKSNKLPQPTNLPRVSNDGIAREVSKDNLSAGESPNIPVHINGELPSKADISSKDAISSTGSNSDIGKPKRGVNIEKNVVGSLRSNENYVSNTAVETSSASQNAVVSMKTLGSKFDGITPQTPNSADYVETRMHAVLMNRISAKQIRKNWLASTANNYKNIASDKKTEQTTQVENVIPRLNLKVPYRFGGGLDWQKGTQIKTVTGEVLVAKKFSISAGLSWLKIKPMEFLTRETFRQKSKQDFPNDVPKAFQVTNIRVEPTLVQIPLTVAFRNDLKDNFAYFVGAGANVTVKSNEKISYTCLVPNPRTQFISQSLDRKMDISPINSINFSFGLEKTWHPIVVQAEGYIYSYFKPLNPLTPRSGPGFRVKLLYQIGRKM